MKSTRNLTAATLAVSIFMNFPGPWIAQSFAQRDASRPPAGVRASDHDAARLGASERAGDQSLGLETQVVDPANLHRLEAANDPAAGAELRAPVASEAAAADPSSPLAANAPAPIGEPSHEEHPISIVSIPRLEEVARGIISAGRFAFMGPYGDGWTYAQNRKAFDDYPIRRHSLQGVVEAELDLSTTLLGHKLPIPVITCPTGSQGWLHAEQELPNAKAAGEVGTIFTASGASNKSLEEIAAATKGPHWFQIYMNRDMSLNRELLARARAAGYSAIVFTADGLGRNESDDYIALGRPIPPGLTFGNHDPARGGRGNFPDFKRDISFKEIEWLREVSGLPVIVKGLLWPADILEALKHGADGIWISNHGGRQMDGNPASIHQLRDAVDTVRGFPGRQVPVILDSGIRRGIDVFRALALGATAVGIGRPALWGLISGGSQGVKAVYGQLAAELKAVMQLSGVQKLTDITREHLAGL